MNSDKEIIPYKYNYLFQISIVLFYLMIFLKYYVGESNPVFQLLFTLSYIFIGFSITLYFLFKIEKNSLIFILMILILFSSFLVSLLSDNYRIEDNLLVLTYFGVSVIPLYVKLNYKLFQIFAIIIISFFGFCIFTDIQPDEIFDVSRNFISVLLLIGTGYHVISSYQNDKNPSLLIIILALIIAIWALGRAGIISFLMLLVTFPFLFGMKNRYKVLLILLVAFLIYYAFTNFNSLLFEYGLGRFEQMDLESDRSQMNADYVSMCLSSFKDFFVGSSLSSIPSIAYVDNNPHNSFIRLHIYYGIIGFVIILCVILYSFFRLFKTKNYLFLVVLIVLLLRSSVDSVAFHGPFDPLIYYLLFYSIKDIKIIA